MVRWLDRRLSLFPGWRRLRRRPGFRAWLGFEETIWIRKVADEEVRKLVATLQPETLSVLEVSGRVWADFGFREYRSTSYPDFDLTRDVLPQRFDLIIAEHVFEHLLWPYRAGRNVLEMLADGGHFLVVTPFLYRVHDDPVDCTRWTETGLRHFLAECGFSLEGVRTGSWGNRRSVEASFTNEYRLFNRRVHPLRVEKEYPIVVWALARAPAAGQDSSAG